MGRAASDIELVKASLAGEVAAFAHLVERYQSLICAVSFSATGDRALSEDVAQETFVAAWNTLGDLREPAKLKGWLCGIARNLSAKALRRTSREVPSDVEVQQALTMPEIGSPTPLDSALQEESEKLVWDALQRVPQAYREPLVLFYREGQSTKQVAEALGLSASTVQKRLSRGRRYLKRSVADLVEHTLARTKPPKSFTTGVVAAISIGAAGGGEAIAAPSAGALGSTAKTGSLAMLVGGLFTMKGIFKLGAVVVLLILLAVGSTALFSMHRGAAATAPAGLDGSQTHSLLASLNAHRADDPDPSAAIPAAASGRVVIAGSHTGIAGARVVLTDTSHDAGAHKRPGRAVDPITAVTDSDGGWAIESVPFGTYVLSAAAEGYVPGVLRGVALDPGGQSAGLEIELQPGGSVLVGDVADIGGGPVDQAFVSAIRVDKGSLIEVRRPSFATLSDERGRYRLPLERGTYTVSVSHPDYVGQSRTVDFTRAGQSEGFALLPGGVIEGQVLASDSEEPVAGALVTFSAGRGAMQARGMTDAIAALFGADAVVTDSEGRFRRSGMSSGLVEISARAGSYSSARPTDVELGIAEHVTGVKVWVDGAHTLSGFVVAKENNEPVPEALVIVTRMGAGMANYSAPRKTRDDGYFEIVGIRPGSYAISAVTPGRLPDLMGRFVTVTDRDVADVIVEVARGTILRGRVNPAAQASITASIDTEGSSFSDMFAAMSSIFVQAETDADGNFTIHGAPNGTYDLVAEAADGSGGKMPVLVQSEDIDGLVIELESRGRLGGKVVDQRGEPLAGKRVRIERVDRQRAMFSLRDLNGGKRIVTDSSGQFSAAGLEAGEYALSVHGDSVPAHAMSSGHRLPWAKSQAPWEPMNVSLKGSQERDDLVLAIAASVGEIRGAVVDSAGQPVPDAWVSGRWLGPGKPGEKSPGRGWSDEASGPVLTDEQGRFTLSELREGRYRITANHPKASARAKKDDVATGEQVTLALEALGRLEGRIALRGAAASSYRAQLSGPTWRVEELSGGSGGFVMERLDPGTYELRVFGEQGSATARIAVSPGETTKVDLELTGWGSVSGQVVDAKTGEPIAGVPVLAMAQLAHRTNDSFGNMLTGGGPKTDENGRFKVDNIGAGSGLITIYSGGFTGSDPIGSRLFALEQGQSVDIGVIRARRPPDNVDKEQRGSTGLTAEAALWHNWTTTDDGQMSHPSFDAADRYLLVTEAASPASDAGIAVGDHIVAIDGIDVAEIGPQAAALLVQPARTRIGQEIALTIERDGTSFTARVTAIARPGAPAQPAP